MSKNKGGRPSLYRPEFHPEDFVRQSRDGKTFKQIAASWNIDRDTLLKWSKRHKEFNGTIKRGRQLAEAWYMDIGRSAMMGQVKIDGKLIRVELGWFVWMTKNMFKWGEGKRPSFDITKITDEILSQEIQRRLNEEKTPGIIPKLPEKNSS